MFFSYADETFENYLRNLRNEKKTMVFTNGCFDILHPGHLQYLWQASNLADVLVVGLNTDESVKKLKGQTRPVNNLKDRLLMLSNLSYVDAVVPFSEDTPVGILETVRPDIHVKGGDYIAEKLPEYTVVKKYGGRAVILPFRKGYSTTGILEKGNRRV
ncbi:MAG: D-glycero-beta-D-manno-heptose 1-phosphate adenylyltransferase [Spirochaetia bacterium]|nr:D-glycero-beta-D-manno-heptose 1-phosphate adenylyltransferase [Spirochaetia bacterium]